MRSANNLIEIQLIEQKKEFNELFFISHNYIDEFISNSTKILKKEVHAFKSPFHLTKKFTNQQYVIIVSASKENIIWKGEEEVILNEVNYIQILDMHSFIKDHGRNLNLESGDFQGAFLEAADFSESDLSNCNFRGANLCLANFKNANLEGANFEGANLIEANLFGANLRNTDLRRANLTLSELRNSKLNGTSLRGAELWSSSIWGVDLSKAFTTGVDLSRADNRGSE
ncbi:pentapeptide repeat-containing protein [Sutcliffiella horikoshii]|uniref:pentapeptide repeat-containing protein n=1 Tax=Sutcliffiella horikoshii TaxID=79883 RepID=UPI003CEC2E72